MITRHTNNSQFTPQEKDQSQNIKFYHFQDIKLYFMLQKIPNDFSKGHAFN